MHLEKLFPGADPFLLKHGGQYYIYCTTEGGTPPSNARKAATDADEGFNVYRSDDLIHWENQGLCLSPGDVDGRNRFWAPEVSYYKGKFYMVYTAEEQLFVAVSASPLGPFTKHSDGSLRRDKAIDGHLLFDGDRIYLYYVRLDCGNHIFVAEMSDDLSRIVKEFETELIAASKPWETRHGLVAEGPFVLKHGGLYYLSYSCNDTGSEYYAVGYAVSNCPTGPFAKYEYNPILKKNGKIVGTGHNSYAPTDDENRFLCAYHCHNDASHNRFPRMVCLCDAFFEKENPDTLKICFE